MLGFDRTVFVPSAALSLRELEAATRRAVAHDAAASAALGDVTYAVDEKVSDAVASFPTRVACDRALALGLSAAGLEPDAIVRAYCDDFPDALAPAVLAATRARAAVAPGGDGGGGGGGAADEPTPSGALDASGAAAAAGAAAEEAAAAAGERAAGWGRQSVVLVTGGGTGIGRAVALRLAAGDWVRDDGDEIYEV